MNLKLYPLDRQKCSLHVASCKYPLLHRMYLYTYDCRRVYKYVLCNITTLSLKKELDKHFFLYYSHHSSLKYFILKTIHYILY